MIPNYKETLLLDVSVKTSRGNVAHSSGQSFFNAAQFAHTEVINRLYYQNHSRDFGAVVRANRVHEDGTLGILKLTSEETLELLRTNNLSIVWLLKVLNVAPDEMSNMVHVAYDRLISQTMSVNQISQPTVAF